MPWRDKITCFIIFCSKKEQWSKYKFRIVFFYGSIVSNYINCILSVGRSTFLIYQIQNQSKIELSILEPVCLEGRIWIQLIEIQTVTIFFSFFWLVVHVFLISALSTLMSEYQDNNVKRDFVLSSIFYSWLAVDMFVFHRNIWCLFICQENIARYVYYVNIP